MAAGPASGTGAALGVYRTVRDHGERAAEINEFFNAFTHRRRSLEGYRWEWYGGPGGPSWVWAILEPSTERVVGHHGIIRIPMVKRGERIAGGRTENTIVDPSVRTKIFYAGVEKRALREVLAETAVLYTVFASGAHARVRQRLGYATLGNWVSYLPRIRRAFVKAGVAAASARLGLRLPAWSHGALAFPAAGLWAAAASAPRLPSGAALEEIADVPACAAEYERMWSQARNEYALTIDRTLEFLRWRFFDNPHVRYRTWFLRVDGTLLAVLIGHQRAAGEATMLEIDDVIVAHYQEAAFDAAVTAAALLAPELDAVRVMTLASDTPLHRVLQQRFPLQAQIMRRYGRRLADDFMGFDRDGAGGDAPWYVTPAFAEGLGSSGSGA